MLSKAKIKHIQSLRLGKFRKQYGQFVAEGSINVLDFIAGKLEIVDIFATSEWVVRYRKETRKIGIIEAETRELGKASALKTAPEVLAIFEMPEPSKIDFESLGSISLMLDDIKDPGNLGTIIRTADWFGIRQIICSEETVDCYNPKVVQASMGSLARVRIHYKKLEKVIRSKPVDIPVYGAVMNGSALHEIAIPEKAIVLIGSEAHGISDKLLKFLDKRISIPSASDGGAESLNAAIATAIICYAFSG